MIAPTPMRAENESITALTLPTDFTIRPDADAPPMVNSGGTIAALIQSPAGDSRIAIWLHGSREILPLPPVPKDIAEYQYRDHADLTSVTPAGRIEVNAKYRFSGAWSGWESRVFSYDGSKYQRQKFEGCKLPGYEAQAGALDGKNFAVTFLHPATPTYNMPENVADGSAAPYAAVVGASGCSVLGRATIRSFRAPYGAGFRHYLAAAIVPPNVSYLGARYIAVRWANGRFTNLGEGLAYDTNHSGACVGITSALGDPDGVGGSTITRRDGTLSAPANIIEPKSGSAPAGVGLPQAILWEKSGSRVLLTPRARTSIAYAIDEHGTIAGMLEDGRGRHYAFVWRNKKLDILDDLLRNHAWRFEAAFGFTGDGGIYGVGNRNGVATAFIVHL